MPDRIRCGMACRDIGMMARTHQARLGGRQTGGYARAPGFHRRVWLGATHEHRRMLASGRRVGAEPQRYGGEPLGRTMPKPTVWWRARRAGAGRLDDAIAKNVGDPEFQVMGGKT